MKKWIKIVLLIVLAIGLIPIKSYKSAYEYPEVVYEYYEHDAVLWNAWGVKKDNRIGHELFLKIPSCCWEWWHLGQYLFHITIDLNAYGNQGSRISVGSPVTGIYLIWSSKDAGDCHYCEK